MTRSAETLLASLIDYAGTFPPATLGLAEAAREYSRQRSGTSRAMLGRFVLAATDLDAFETMAPAVATAAPPWELAIVGKRETMPDAERVRRFNRVMKGRAAVIAAEYAVMPASEIGPSARQLPDDIVRFFEVPVGGDVDVEESVTAIAAASACAKIRTGGITAGAFPEPMPLVAFIQACHHAGVAFKATAGLHHAVCGSYPLTYEPLSARANMYGFLNVSLAAALVHVGCESGEAIAALRESSPDAFAFSEASLTWKKRVVTIDHLTDARRHFFKSFGSCAFQEPVEELKRLGIIAGPQRSAGSVTASSHD